MDWFCSTLILVAGRKKGGSSEANSAWKKKNDPPGEANRKNAPKKG